MASSQAKLCTHPRCEHNWHHFVPVLRKCKCKQPLRGGLKGQFFLIALELTMSRSFWIACASSTTKVSSSSSWSFPSSTITLATCLPDPILQVRQENISSKESTFKRQGHGERLHLYNLSKHLRLTIIIVRRKCVVFHRWKAANATRHICYSTLPRFQCFFCPLWQLSVVKMLQGWPVHLWLLAWVSASDWSCHVGNLIQPIRSTTQIWVVTCQQCGISALISQTSFGGETSGSIKCWLFSQAIAKLLPGHLIFKFFLLLFNLGWSRSCTAWPGYASTNEEISNNNKLIENIVIIL